MQYRLPFGLVRAGWQPWLSTMGTNLAIAILVVTVMWFMGVRAFLLVELPITLLGASMGVWLFYVQHQFEDTFWAHEGSWNQHEAALHGSSHYDLPGILRWFTANIGGHHIHHLCSRGATKFSSRSWPTLDGRLWPVVQLAPFSPGESPKAHALRALGGAD